MDARLQRRVQRYGWDRAVDEYEPGWRQALAPAQRRLLEMAALAPGEHVLDVACGTGLIAIPAAETIGPEGAVVATDLSDAMVAATARAAASRGLANVACRQMEAEALGLPAGAFDATLCGLGLMYFPDPVAALREMRRVLRPGGRVAVAVWGARSDCGWSGIFPVVEARVSTDVCPMFFQLGTGDTLAIALAQAGFVSISTARVPTVLQYASGVEACAAAFAGGPVAMAYARFTPEVRRAAERDYLESIAAYRRGRGYAIPGSFVVASASRV
jgi:ubiquinone/menaquinone biosynthesis C-methylase UbiE